MYPRTNYEMTTEDMETLLAAMAPVRAMMESFFNTCNAYIGCLMPTDAPSHHGEHHA